MILTRRRVLAASATTLAMPYVARAQQAQITLAAYAGIFQDNYEPAVVEPFRRANPAHRSAWLLTLLGVLEGALSRPSRTPRSVGAVPASSPAWPASRSASGSPITTTAATLTQRIGGNRGSSSAHCGLLARCAP